MKVSVIIPTYNRAGLITRAISSVLNQSYKDFEIIVIDDGSIDDTDLIVSKFSSVKYFKIPNVGVSKARNFGVSKSSGEYIAFLDSDDEWAIKKLELQVNYLKENPDIRIVYSDEKWVRNGVFVNKKKNHQKYEGSIFDKCLEQCFVGPSSVLLDKRIFADNAGFDESYLICEDFEFWLRLSYKYSFGLIKEELVIKYGGHEDQLSTIYPAMDHWRIRALYKFLQSTPSLESEYNNLVKSIIIKKSEYLLAGFIKHGREEDFLEISEIIKSIE